VCSSDLDLDLTVRPAEPDDVPALCRMAREFYAFAQCADHGLGYDERDLLDTFSHLATAPDGYLAVADAGAGPVGMVAGLLVPWYARKADVIAQEVWLWADPEHRRSGAGPALLRAFESWAREAGATRVLLATPGAADRDPVVARWYRRQGYRQVETVWGRGV